MCGPSAKTARAKTNATGVIVTNNHLKFFKAYHPKFDRLQTQSSSLSADI
jgi:hypothetical protein